MSRVAVCGSVKMTVPRLKAATKGIELLWTPLRQSDRVSCHCERNVPNEKDSFRHAMVLSCWIEIALGEVVVRDPVRIQWKRTGRDLNPLNLAVVYHALRTGSRAYFDVLFVK